VRRGDVEKNPLLGGAGVGLKNNDKIQAK